MQPSAYPIPLDAPGRLWIMPKPSPEWLADDLAAYRRMGMSRIVSLLTRDEAAELGLRGEAALSAAGGLAFVQHPIPDRSVPADPAAFALLARDTLAGLMAGQGVGIHCRAGIGRSGMLACCVLVLHGLAADAAIARVSMARGVGVPDTEAQAAYIREAAAARPASASTLDGTFAC
jgi:protein-tyrosine phosphatase